VSSPYCCCSNHADSSKPILKLFTVSIENWIDMSVPKIISKCCELVKLCHSNHSGPVFWDTVYICVTSVTMWSTPAMQCFSVLHQCDHFIDDTNNNILTEHSLTTDDTPSHRRWLWMHQQGTVNRLDMLSSSHRSTLLCPRQTHITSTYTAAAAAVTNTL